MDRITIHADPISIHADILIADTTSVVFLGKDACFQGGHDIKAISMEEILPKLPTGTVVGAMSTLAPDWDDDATPLMKAAKLREIDIVVAGTGGYLKIPCVLHHVRTEKDGKAIVIVSKIVVR